MCYDNAAKAQGISTLRATPPKGENNISVTTVENGFIVQHSGTKDGEWFNRQYIANGSAEVGSRIIAILGPPAPAAPTYKPAGFA